MNILNNINNNKRGRKTMKTRILGFIIVFVSFSTMAFALTDEVRIPSNLYKVDDISRNIEMYHTARGADTLTTAWGYIIFTNVYYRNNAKSCWLVFDLNSDADDSSANFTSVIFYDKKGSNNVVLNLASATDRENLFTESDATIHLRKLRHIVRKQYRLSDNEIDALIKLIEDNKFKVDVRFVSRNNNYYPLSRKDFSKNQARSLYDLLKFYKEIRNK